MTPTTRYPTNAVTPHGAYYILSGRIPMMAYRSYDDTSVFHLMGGLAIPDRQTPESIRLVSMRGLVPPWKAIEQKGATQDGSTFVTALYEPLEIDLVLEAQGRDPEHTRRLVRDWIAAWDAKQPGELSFFTPEMGRWWSAVRWSRNPVDDIRRGNFIKQKFTWPARGYDAFWRTYDHVTQFGFSYADASDGFDVDHPSDLGSGWTIAYSGPGTGIVYTVDSQVHATLDSNKTAVCRKNSFTTTSDNQVVVVDIGRFPSTWWFPTNAYVDVWCRMANSGTPGDDGVRLRIGHRTLKLSSFASGVETVIRQVSMRVPSQTKTQIAVIAGFEDDPRMFKVLRNGATIMSAKESGTTSHLGSGYRSAGFGVCAEGTTDPPTVWNWAAGDNATAAQSGFASFVNVGDQDMWPRYTCFGPGTFRLGNGPGSPDYVEFGPLLKNQVMQIRTDPSKRGVVDLTSVPASTQEYTAWQQALLDFVSFATCNNVPPLVQEILSMFGILPPQGNPYSLMHGRFTNPIPPKPAGAPAPAYQVNVSIQGGNADSKIIAAGTPLRRWPW